MKNLKKLPTYIIYSALFGIFVATPVSASESITTNVSVEPSLTLSLSASSLALNLDPSITTFGYKDLDVIVGTNNATGYKLTMSTTSGDTNLVNTEDDTKVIETLPTLAGGYTDSTFIVNKWGYKKNRNTDNYNSFPATQTLLENDERTNEDIANLRFGTKIDYLQESGTYATNIEFNLVANPLVSIETMVYMQDFARLSEGDLAAVLDSMEEGVSYPINDSRDEQTYTIAKLADDRVWMTRNLAIGCNGNGLSYGNVITPIELTAADSNVSSPFVTPQQSAITYGDSYTEARIVCTNYGGYYNYTASTAGTIYGTSNTQEAEYDVCPVGWALPTLNEANTIISAIGTDPASINPIAAGFYQGGALQYTEYGYMTWTKTAPSTSAGSTCRNELQYIKQGNYLKIGISINGQYDSSRVRAYNLRCILK